MQSLCGFEDFLGVPLDLDPAPFTGKVAVAVDQEGTALDAEVLLAVEFLQLDHVEQLAQLLFLVGDQLEIERLLGLEVFLGANTVTGSAKNDRIGGFELSFAVAKITTLGSAAGGAGLGVEKDHYLTAFKVGRGDRGIAGSGDGEVGYGLADNNGHVGLLNSGTVVKNGYHYTQSKRSCQRAGTGAVQLCSA